MISNTEFNTVPIGSNVITAGSNNFTSPSNIAIGYNAIGYNAGGGGNTSNIGIGDMAGTFYAYGTIPLMPINTDNSYSFIGSGINNTSSTITLKNYYDKENLKKKLSNNDKSVIGGTSTIANEHHTTVMFGHCDGLDENQPGIFYDGIPILTAESEIVEKLESRIAKLEENVNSLQANLDKIMNQLLENGKVSISI
jgi:hypothetical protein